MVNRCIAPETMKISTLRKNFAYSLLELIVVVAIVGLISAVAAPVYQNYIEHSKVTEINTQIAYYLQQWAENYNSNPTFTAITPTPTSKYISSVTLDNTNGVIIILKSPSNIMSDFDDLAVEYTPYMLDDSANIVNPPFTSSNPISNHTIYYACGYAQSFNGAGGDSPNVDQWLTPGNPSTVCTSGGGQDYSNL